VLEVRQENGDTYSEEPGERLGVLSRSAPLAILQKSKHHCVVGYTAEWQAGEQRVTASIRIYFDPAPLIKWEIDLDSRGSGLRVDMVLETARIGERYAGMPFDLVPRPVADTDLLPRQIPKNLEKVLLGQREIGQVSTFPFQDLLALTDGETTTAIFAKGLHAYSVDESGTVKLPLVRTVEWLTKPDLKNRVGDAGPFFYVPDARCERAVSHELAVGFVRFPASSMSLQAMNAAYQNPPLIVRGHGEGAQTTWQVFHEELPVSSLAVMDGSVLVRLYNPTHRVQTLNQTYLQTDMWGKAFATVEAVQPKQIVTVRLGSPTERPLSSTARNRKTGVECLTLPKWRVGKNTGLPDPEILTLMRKKITELEEQVARTEAQIAKEQGAERLKLQHRYYVLKRESVELKLSLLLNLRKLEAQGAADDEYLFAPDEEIAALGLELNQLRIKRRIFDYVVQAI
jgi:hypothetical protein